MLLTLPVETFEHIISSLAGDLPSLAACSLICHGLLPIARTWLWQEVTLPLNQDEACCQRTDAFLCLLDNPAIAHCIRSLILHPRKSVHVGEGVPFDRVTWNILSARLPALRSLRLRILVIGSLYEVVEVIRDRSTLEALYLEDVDLLESHRKVPAWPQPPTRTHSEGAVDEPLLPLCALRTLSIVGGDIFTLEVVQLALFLEQAKGYMPRLESLDLCCATPHNFARDNRPQTGPGIPSYGASLRHFGITFNIEPPMSFLFNHLPLPRLESLSIVLISPAAWIAGFTPSFARLAEALVGDAERPLAGGTGMGRTGRFPRFSHLSLRVSFRTIIRHSWGPPGPENHLEEDECDRQEEVRAHVVPPMLADFVQAGVYVEVTFD
ncbi:hypothetical protein TRAPUB_4997 [Trametes pubescens]|uniref:F-box domain-containing protein n=1 Tax=Trametes pubescens TaxID=154538 RepID=A0A1M2V9R4_TRAPU|nr:hypothetical protein TRAPUB_4997 [Trametes pubescens]